MAVLLMLVSGCSRRVQNQSSRPAELKSSTPLNAATRKVYAYSLIPGGVESAAMFGIYRVSDKVLLDHFHDMGGRIVTTQLARDKWMYSSYRISDSIYWTKNRVLIRAGERLLTDGDTLVRARCGNRLSESPQHPMQTFQPPPGAMDTVTTEITVVMPPDLIPDLPDVAPVTGPIPLEQTYTPAPPPDAGLDVPPTPLPPDTTGQVILPSPPLIGPFTPTPPYSPPSIAPTIPTPEMSTGLLMFLGFFGMSLGLVRKLRFHYSLRKCRIVL